MASDPPFTRIGIVGLGLIGGSSALRTRATWPAVRLIGIDREQSSREALAIRIVDEV